jgi:hypothetical protein
MRAIVTNVKCIHKEMKIRLTSGSASYCYIQIYVSPCVLC